MRTSSKSVAHFLALSSFACRNVDVPNCQGSSRAGFSFLYTNLCKRALLAKAWPYSCFPKACSSCCWAAENIRLYGLCSLQ